MQKYYTTTGKPSTGLGYLGFVLIFIAILINLVIVVEYDPVMLQLKSGGHPVQGVIIGKRQKKTKQNMGAPPALNDLHFSRKNHFFKVRFKTTDGDAIEIETVPFANEYFFDSRAAGDTVGLIYLRNGKSITVACRETLPSTPRGNRDFIFPVIIFLLGAALVALHPSVLYTMREER